MITRDPRARPRIAISTGDPNGIGPEVILKALCRPDIRALANFTITGPKRVFESVRDDKGRALLPVITRDADDALVFAEPEGAADYSPELGKVCRAGGLIAGVSIEAALQLARQGAADAVVTAPISKHALNLAGYAFPGHTELLAKYFEVDKVVMMMVCDAFRVALVTTHCALSRVSSLLSKDGIVTTVRILHSDLVTRFEIRRPRIAVCALNPHAGEHGMFGKEEQTIISPAISELKNAGFEVDGPYPADTLFTTIEQNKYDAYLAMYHDQGLIPAKMRSFERTVNYTAGLPVVRTSPDHGTAYDIAGKGIATSTSIEEAIKLASALAAKKQES